MRVLRAFFILNEVTWRVKDVDHRHVPLYAAVPDHTS